MCLPVIFVLVGLTTFIILRRRRNLKKIEEFELANISESQIKFSELKFNRILGVGSFGKVFLGEFQRSEVAIKKISDIMIANQNLGNFIAEAEIMKNIPPHPNIVGAIYILICAIIVESLKNLGSISWNHSVSRSCLYCIRILLGRIFVRIFTRSFQRYKRR